METDKIYFTIKGKDRNCEIDDKDVDGRGYSISYEEKGANLIVYTKKAYFFEYENYELLIEKKDKDIDLSFYHENKDIRNKITKNRSGSLSGIVTFKGEIGYSDLVIRIMILPVLKDLLKEARKPEELAKMLNVGKGQMEIWIRRAIEDKAIEKFTKKPVKYKSL